MSRGSKAVSLVMGGENGAKDKKCNKTGLIFAGIGIAILVSMIPGIIILILGLVERGKMKKNNEAPADTIKAGRANGGTLVHFADDDGASARKGGLIAVAGPDGPYEAKARKLLSSMPVADMFFNDYRTESLPSGPSLPPAGEPTLQSDVKVMADGEVPEFVARMGSASGIVIGPDGSERSDVSMGSGVMGPRELYEASRKNRTYGRIQKSADSGWEDFPYRRNVDTVDEEDVILRRNIIATAAELDATGGRGLQVHGELPYVAAIKERLRNA